jgi:hypothetical protein
VNSRVLLIGDVTDRLLAVAARLPAASDPVLLTGSPVLPDAPLLVEHLPEMDRPPRATLLRDRLRHLIELHDIGTVVLDGTPEDGLLAATGDHPDVYWRWLRPAMWRRGQGLRWRGRSAAFDAVLEPGEFAAPGDEGWTVYDRDGVTTVPPITTHDRADLLGRGEARAGLGLSEQEPAVVFRGISAEVPGFTPIEPDARALRAADLAVATAGYTAYHELLAAGVPTVFVPDPGAGPDDQLARARFTAAAGAALCAERPADLDDRLALAVRPEVRAALAARCADVAFENGAAAAAAWIGAAT